MRALCVIILTIRSNAPYAQEVCIRILVVEDDEKLSKILAVALSSSIVNIRHGVSDGAQYYVEVGVTDSGGSGANFPREQFDRRRDVRQSRV